MTNLNNAFEVAEKYLDIPKMLDAEGKRPGGLRRGDFGHGAAPREDPRTPRPLLLGAEDASCPQPGAVRRFGTVSLPVVPLQVPRGGRSPGPQPGEARARRAERLRAAAAAPPPQP